MKHSLLDIGIKAMIIALRKKGRTDDKKYLIKLSDVLDTSRRKRSAINVFKLNLIAKRHKDKIFLVPGTLLGYGEVEFPINVYAFKYSKVALEKLTAAKSVAKTFENLLTANVSGKDVIILK